MSDVVSLELLLDEQTEERVRAEWRALAEAGLSSMAAHPSPSNRPHITLLVRPSLPPLAVAVVARAVALPMDVALGAPLLFGCGERRVLARSVVATAELLELHRALHDIVGPGDDAAHTRPGEWMPHVTLARRIRLDALPQALRALDALVPPDRPAATTTPGASDQSAAPATPTVSAAPGASGAPAATTTPEPPAAPGIRTAHAVTLRRWDSATATVTDVLTRP
ncbi:2'-5' RNA ligase family protein [Subtercola sp. YIM 133946]|uniref:2'-5' RNA ligase family protein n=1 Tax=Subtercola sp. YIM 133946 TaxID=3118909 RepID=UPI002F95F869